MKHEYRQWKHGPVRLVGPKEPYVMVRRPGAAPMVITKREWDAMPIVAPESGQ